MVMNEPPESASNPAAICDRLKQVRIQVCGPRGQSHFAALLQLSPSTYNYYEKGRIPPVDVLDRASRITDVPLLWLIRGEPADFDVRSLRKIDQPTRENSPGGGTPGGGGMTPIGSLTNGMNQPQQPGQPQPSQPQQNW